MEKAITERTLVPIGIAVVVLGGGAFWLSSLSYQCSANTQDIQEIKMDQKSYAENLSEIREGIAEIKGKLEELTRGK